MVYAKEAKALQFATIGIQIFCLILGILCANADERWNVNSFSGPPVSRVDLLHTKYKLTKPYNYEEELMIENAIHREYVIQVIGLTIFGILLLSSMIHCYLCFILSNLYYRKYLNIYFHLVGAVVLLGGFLCYVVSFVRNNETYDLHFDILYEGLPWTQVPFNPCKFPQSESGFIQLFTGRPYACQDTWTKFFVILFSFCNIFLYLCTAFVVGFFVEEEDAAEMLYKQMEIAGGGPLTPLDKLPPLPYYARPLANSPTAKKRLTPLPPNFIRVEVDENWPFPPPGVPMEVAEHRPSVAHHHRPSVPQPSDAALEKSKGTGKKGEEKKAIKDEKKVIKDEKKVIKDEKKLSK